MTPLPKQLPAPLSDPRRSARWYFYAALALAFVFAVVMPLRDAHVRGHLDGSALLFVAFLFVLVVLPQALLLLALVPRTPPRVLYLRSFRSDATSVRLKETLEIVFAPGLRLEGIRRPRKRWPMSLRILFMPAFLVGYQSRKFLGLEAGDDWAPRLWRSLGDCHGAVVDLRTATDAVALEIRLAVASLGWKRVAFIVEPGTSAEDVRRRLSEALASYADGNANPVHVLPWDPTSTVVDPAFLEAADGLREAIVPPPRDAAQRSRSAFGLVADRMLSASARLRESIGPVSGLLLGLALVLLPPVLAEWSARGQTAEMGAHTMLMARSVTMIAGLISVAVTVAALPRLAGLARRAQRIHPEARPTYRRRFWCLFLGGSGPFLIVLFLTITVIGPALWRHLGNADGERARSDMHNIGSAIDMYRIDHRKLPYSLDELTEGDRRGQPYVDRVSDDPWGNPYQINVLGQRRYEIVSYGPDGQEGTGDDLVYPERDADED